MDKFGLAAVGAVCVAGMEGVALYMGHDGVLLTTAVGAVCALIGGAIGFKAAV